MRSFVIAILHHEKSMAVAERCIRSGHDHGLDIEIFPAITPKDDLKALMQQEGISINGFIDKYSHAENSLACFLSHYFLWKQSIELNEEINIFEHDAMLLDTLPKCEYQHVINWGMPSYGKWKEPKHIGVQKLFSRKHFPGTHAYGVRPEGARMLVEKASKKAATPDRYLSLENFPSLQEHYPFMAEARDSFTTIQKPRYSMNKHNYTKRYTTLLPS